MFTKGDIIHTYTRAEAIADGVLVDVSSAATEAGFKYPVALTRAVWSDYVEVPEGVFGQDESGRLWDILVVLNFAVRRSNDGDMLRFRLHVRNENGNGCPSLVELKAICGPNDDGTPCVTVMLPYED